MFFDYIKHTYAPKQTINMYQTQVEKYKDIVEEIQKSYIEEQSQTQEKIDMEEELSNYVFDQIEELRL